MSEKIKGTVKWFSNLKGFGFITPSSDNSPTKDDIFVHQSNIVTEAEYRTLKDGFDVEFEVITDENGKLKAQNVTAADGSPCPGPEPRDRRRRRQKKEGKENAGAATENEGGAGEEASGEKSDGANGEKTDTTGNEATPADGEEGAKGKGGKKSRNRRRRNRNGKKNDDGKKPEENGAASNGSNDGAAEKESKPAKQQAKSWFSDFDEEVKSSLEKRSIKFDGGRAFIAIGDSRIKLGTGGYTALAHASALLAEGTFSCDNDGKITITWTHVLKYDSDEWKLSTVEAEKEILLSEINLADESVTATGNEETTETLWGEGKADPKEALEKNGLQMRKLVLHATTGGGRRRYRNRGRKNKSGGGGEPKGEAKAK